MNENYPEICHDVMKGEVDLLCCPVSKMFASTNEMALEYEQKLTAAGCDFDEFGRILSVSDGACCFLQDKLTPATIVYFAFGAEYHQYLIDDVTILSKLSIPLLMVIAFQPRFAASNHKKACALLRRKLPTVLGNFTAVKRKAMPFPINIIEDAYCREPKYFNNTAGIKTDSENEEGKKEVKNGDEKRRKKSSKKRH
uniref:Uncharacterized protein n=1 Tax=Panagrolaimus superbus TaxID=310955 RepID=A0A914XWH3_9BILA